MAQPIVNRSQRVKLRHPVTGVEHEVTPHQAATIYADHEPVTDEPAKPVKKTKPRTSEEDSDGGTD